MTKIAKIRAALEMARELAPAGFGMPAYANEALAALAELEMNLDHLRVESKAWQSAYDDCEDALIGEQQRDSYGHGESIADCARRVLRERDQLRDRLAEYAQAPTVAEITDWHGHLSVYPTTVRLPQVGTQLIARPEAK